MREIGSLTKVRIREVWPNEAADLTPWLAKNPDLLGEALGMGLELVDTEVAVGPFSADILFRVRNANALVVVENMMGPSDHDHLGKTITYASGIEAAREEGLEATYAVLLAERIRDEHRMALTWMNTHTDQTKAVRFFGVEIEVWRIGNSLPAPRLNVVVQPDNWAQQFREVVRDRGLTEEHLLHREFWSEFLPPLDAAHPGWLSDSAKVRKGQSKAGWLTFPQARDKWYAVARERVGDQQGICVEFCVNNEEDDMERIYDGLLEHRSTIEAQIGEGLQWKETPKMRKIFILNPKGIDFEDRERWPEVREWAIKRLGDLRDAIQPHLDELASDGG